jgi:hypothetical protein
MEKTILHSLSHSQFICYGLLKIYLKEVLGSFEEINDLKLQLIAFHLSELEISSMVSQLTGIYASHKTCR